MGFPGLTPSTAIESAIMESTRPTSAALQEIGYAGITLTDAIRARDHGVDAGFATVGQRRLGRTPTIDELIRMRDSGDAGN